MPSSEQRRELSTTQWVAVIWSAIAVVILAVYFLAPKRDAIPPPSKVSYGAAKPETTHAPSDRHTVFGHSTRGRNSKTQDAEAPLGMEVKTGGRCLIYGTVLNAKTQLPLEHARVAAVQRVIYDGRAAGDAAPAASTTSDASIKSADSKDLDYGAAATLVTGSPTAETNDKGEFRIYLEPNVSGYRVIARAKGFVSTYEDVELSEQEPKREVELRLKTGASISGRVKEKGTGAPVKDVGVYYGGGQNARVTTDANGNYAIVGLTPGDYELNLDISDAPVLAAKNALTQTVKAPSLDSEIKGIDFTVEPAGVVWGYVWTSERKPAAQCPVILTTSESPLTQVLNAAIKQTAPLTDQADENGYYELSPVPLNKEWRVQSVVDKKFTPQLSDAFMLTTSNRSVQVDLYLPRGNSIDGIVVTPDGTPVPHMEIACIPSLTRLTSPLTSSLGFSGGRSDDSGRFIIEYLTVGDYQIHAIPQKGYKYSLQGTPVYIDGMQDVHNVRVIVTPIGVGNHSVYGTVTNADGSPVPDAKLELMTIALEAMGSEPVSVRSDANGQYQFTGVDEGYHMLNIVADGYAAASIENVKLDEPTDIRLEAAGGVSGVVLARETGQGVAGARVEAMPDFSAGGGFSLANMGKSATTDAQGRFSMDLNAGNYSLRASSGDMAPGGATVRVESGQIAPKVTLYLSEQGATIEGQVVTASGSAVSGAQVNALPTSLSFGGTLPGEIAGEVGGQSVTSDAEGRFTFTKLGAGSYALSAAMEGYAAAKVGPLALNATQTLSGVRLVLGQGGALRGTVAVSGALKPGVVVTIVGNGESKLSTTDANGQYLIENLPAGTYLASAADVGGILSGSFAPNHARVEIYEGQTTTYNFGESSGTTLSGRVTMTARSGMVSFVIVRVPTPEGIQSLNLSNPASWFTADSTTGNYIVGMGQVNAQGGFRIENLPQGEFLLEVYQVGLMSMMSANSRPLFSQIINIENAAQMTMSINIGDSAAANAEGS